MKKEEPTINLQTFRFLVEENVEPFDDIANQQILAAILAQLLPCDDLKIASSLLEEWKTRALEIREAFTTVQELEVDL